MKSEYSELEETRGDHQVHLLAPHSTTQNSNIMSETTVQTLLELQQLDELQPQPLPWRAYLQKLWLTAELDHMKQQRSVKNELPLSVTISYVLQDMLLLVLVGTFLSVPLLTCICWQRKKIHLQ